MKAQAEPFHTRELTVKCLRLQTDGFPAIWRNGGEPSDEGFQRAFRLLHYFNMSTKYGQTLHRTSHGGQATLVSNQIPALGGCGYRVCFPNQLVSRQRRKAIRARCRITQRLFSEMRGNPDRKISAKTQTSSF